MKYYTAIVHQEGESAFGLSFPDLPGCFAAAGEALDLWFEARVEQPARALGEVRHLPRVQAALAAGRR